MENITSSSVLLEKIEQISVTNAWLSLIIIINKCFSNIFFKKAQILKHLYKIKKKINVENQNYFV